jgi:hypothetical protein
MPSSSRRWGWGREGGRRSGAPFLQLDARPSVVGKESVAKSTMRNAMSSSSPVGSAADVSPIATAVTSVAAADVAREEVGWCRFARVARDAIHGSRLVFPKPGGMGDFGGKSDGMQHRTGLTERVIRMGQDYTRADRIPAVRRGLRPDTGRVGNNRTRPKGNLLLLYKPLHLEAQHCLQEQKRV